MNIAGFLYKNGRINEIIRKMAIVLKLYYPYNILYMKKIREMDPPSEQVIDARKLFTENHNRIEVISSMLSDDKSKDTFAKLIRLRQYYSSEDIPSYNYFDQYFPYDIPQFSTKWGGDDVFVDCGAFNGDIDAIFAKKVKNYSEIYAFEPDSSNITQLEKRKSSIRNLNIIKSACSDYEGVIQFSEEEQSGGSHISNENESNKTVSVPCTTIDKIIGDGRCDFIKMDIEGAEWDALHGAAETIQRCKPKLAISIYHSNEDMLRLPEYIHELVPEYRLYVRAHTMGIAETILYAMI